MTQIHNNTKLTIQEIDALRTLCEVDVRWRRRVVKLKLHGGAVVSDGVTYSGGTRVVCLETREQWAREVRGAEETGRFRFTRF